MRLLAYSVLVCTLALACVVNVYPWLLEGGRSGVVELEIPRGARASDIAGVLAQEGVIANEDVFAAGAVLLGIDRKLVAGRYVLPRRISLFSLYEILQTGQRVLHLVTVPEGLTLEETDRLLSEALGFEAGEVARCARDPELLEELGIEAESAEGYLFPDTYDFPPETSPADVVSTMVRRALRVYREALAEASAPPDLGVHEVFTLASIVEAEVTYVDEGPRVAAVFLNRLRVGMPLQADPTVAYALGGRRSRITYRDLEVDSPYNTYRHSGLPPGPICSPGESSIRAVLNPAVPSDEFYFVATGAGRHVFSETIGDHIRAKRRIKSGSPSAAGSGR